MAARMASGKSNADIPPPSILNALPMESFGGLGSPGTPGIFRLGIFGRPGMSGRKSPPIRGIFMLVAYLLIFLMVLNSFLMAAMSALMRPNNIIPSPIAVAITLNSMLSVINGRPIVLKCLYSWCAGILETNTWSDRPCRTSAGPGKSRCRLIPPKGDPNRNDECSATPPRSLYRRRNVSSTVDGRMGRMGPPWPGTGGTSSIWRALMSSIHQV
mmetsp:Transcript_29096/g.67485  ORF Transcript_29096/g.67485 Transcript_29096/m.67485 type:complete len:214 (+) Transcript_29096:1157-1798(+)